MACETFHPLRSELKEVAPENIPVYKDIDLKNQKITILIKYMDVRERN